MNLNDIEIRSLRLVLKPFTANDVDEVFAYITPTLTRYMSWDPPSTRQEFDEVWQSWLRLIAQGQELVCVIRRSSDQKFLGLVGLHHIPHTTPELGIWIREDEHGSGFGREAVTAIAEWASSHLIFQYFLYPVAIENYASRKIAESLKGVQIAQKTQRKYVSVIYAIPRSD